MPELRVCQVAFSVLELDTTLAWYREVFGFAPTGRADDQGGPEAAAMQGLPVLRCDMAWLVGRQDFLQLEFFRYAEPTPAARRPDAFPSDLGWAAVGLSVTDFDDLLRRLDATGTERSTDVLGRAAERRVCVRDPEGVLLDITELDPTQPAARPGLRTAVRFVRLVVADLDQARALFVDALGMTPADPQPPVEEASPVWLGESPRELLVLRSGDVLLELVTYPRSRPRPAGYRISDQGLLNIALGSRDPADYQRTLARIGTRATVHGELEIGSARARYLTAPDGTSVELLTIPDPAIELAAGFDPVP